MLAGPSFRFFKNDGNTINPYTKVKIDYQGGNHSLSWLTTYGVEQPSQTLAAGATTLRTGLSLGVRSNFADQFEGRSLLSSRGKPSGERGAVVNTSTAAQDSLHFTLGLKYTINKHFAAHVDYEYTNQGAGGGTSSGGTQASRGIATSPD